MPGGRGGRRSGKVGKAYGNRSDLNGAQPVATAKGQAYGEAGAQAAAQKAVPMGTPEVAAPAGPFTGAPEGMAKPGSMGDLFADSTNPNEHVMSGAAAGPGPGPEAFGMGGQQADPRDLEKARRWLPALQEIANRPDSTAATRNVVRMLKSKIAMAATEDI